jgi:hypothetical protein
MEVKIKDNSMIQKYYIKHFLFIYINIIKIIIKKEDLGWILQKNNNKFYKYIIFQG